MIEIIYPVPEVFPDNRARFIQIINTCYALAQQGLNVNLVTGIRKKYSIEDLYKFYGLKTCENLKITKLPILRREKARYFKISSNGLFYFSFLVYLLTKQKKHNSIIFLRHLKLANFLLRLKKFFKIPMIFEAHEIFHLSTLNRKKQETLKQIETNVYKNMNALISLSYELKEFLINNFDIDKEQIFVAPDAVKKEWFLIEKKPLYICYTGSLYKWKGVDVLISAMKYIPNEKLLIVGGGERLEELKELAMKNHLSDRIIFAGEVPHTLIPEYLSKAKIAVLPNTAYETSKFSSPLKLFEYMAAGIPIVASDLPVFREILQNQKNALFFEPGNSQALANAIKQILNSDELAQKLSENAKKTAEKYTYEKRAEKICEIIKNLNKNA